MEKTLCGYLKPTLSTVNLQGLVIYRIFFWFFPPEKPLGHQGQWVRRFIRVPSNPEAKACTGVKMDRRAGPRTAARSLLGVGHWFPSVTICFQSLWNLLVSGRDSLVKKKKKKPYNI